MRQQYGSRLILEDVDDDAELKISNQSSSRSPNRKSLSQDSTKLLMQSLTKQPITENTAILINASEVLTKAGIHGKISEVGVGFGTGRHIQKRKSISPP